MVGALPWFLVGLQVPLRRRVQQVCLVGALPRHVGRAACPFAVQGFASGSGSADTLRMYGGWPAQKVDQRVDFPLPFGLVLFVLFASAIRLIASVVAFFSLCRVGV